MSKDTRLALIDMETHGLMKDGNDLRYLYEAVNDLDQFLQKLWRDWDVDGKPMTLDDLDEACGKSWLVHDIIINEWVD